jgi:hypothetical protein
LYTIGITSSQTPKIKSRMIPKKKFGMAYPKNANPVAAWSFQEYMFAAE